MLYLLIAINCGMLTHAGGSTVADVGTIILYIYKVPSVYKYCWMVFEKIDSRNVLLYISIYSLYLFPYIISYYDTN